MAGCAQRKGQRVGEARLQRHALVDAVKKGHCAVVPHLRLPHARVLRHIARLEKDAKGGGRVDLDAREGGLAAVGKVAIEQQLLARGRSERGGREEPVARVVPKGGDKGVAGGGAGGKGEGKGPAGRDGLRAAGHVGVGDAGKGAGRQGLRAAARKGCERQQRQQVAPRAGHARVLGARARARKMWEGAGSRKRDEGAVRG